MNTLTIDFNHTDSRARLATLQGIIRNNKQLISRLEDELDTKSSENNEALMERIERLQSKVYVCELEYQTIKRSLK